MSPDPTSIQNPSEIQNWLRRFKWSLAAIPSPERDDIVAEVAAHLHESLCAGKSPAAVLHQFGSPENYAPYFIDEIELSSALSSQHSGAMIAAVLNRVHRSAIAAALGIALLFLGAIFFTALTAAFLKLWDPAHVGLWHHGRLFFIGKIDDPASARELLGFWLYPCAFVAIALSWLAGRFVLVHGVRSLAQKERFTAPKLA